LLDARRAKTTTTATTTTTMSAMTMATTTTRRRRRCRRDGDDGDDDDDDVGDDDDDVGDDDDDVGDDDDHDDDDDVVDDDVDVEAAPLPPVAEHSGADGLQPGGHTPPPRWWPAASGSVAAGFGVMSAMTTMTAKHTSLLLGGLHAPAAGFDVFLWNASQPQRMIP
jgi:hypothetical protein